MEAKILIVEDDDAIADAIQAYLNKEGIETNRCDNGEDAVASALLGWDLILLDVMLPKLDGFEVCRELRKRDVNVPILFLTARGDDIDQVLGLGLGADDYITKPFSGAALVARVKAHIRRYREFNRNGNNMLDVLRFSGGLEIDTESFLVRRGGESIQLAAKEFELLRLLATNAGRVFTKEQLFKQIWRDKYYEGDDNTVTVHIRRLREKIEADPSNPQYLQTIRGLGYRFSKM
ncbi:response regulator transcription factor [Paenibacillus chartarius]|uniref:Response regulator transcription factor n=1 Tax=Paenibacillus chartarius TaxID=747481 RepID=A0ABV6DS32_9BACL